MFLLVVTLAFKLLEGGGPAVIQVQVDSKAKCESLGAQIVKDATSDFDNILGTVKLKGAKYHCYQL